MKQISIYAVPSHQTRERTSGVDFARVIQPMKHLDGFEHKGYKFKADVFDIFETEEYELKTLDQYLTKSGNFWKEKIPKYDLVFFNYTAIDWHYAVMATFARNFGVKMIMDLDDAIWNIGTDNIAYSSLKEVGAGQVTTAILNDVDRVTTTNRYLKNVIRNNSNVDHKNMGVFPNAVDMKLYNHISKPKDEHEVTLYHYGSTSHFHDLSINEFEKGLDMIFADYPNVVFKAIGASIPRLKTKWGQRYTFGFGHSDVYKWIRDVFPGCMDEADIMVVPLQDTLYNRCKSDIKFIETATAKVPGVFSNVRPYSDTIKHGKNGYLAGTAKEWYESISELMDVKKRREIGNNAYKYVKKERQIEKLIPDYADFILETLASQA